MLLGKQMQFFGRAREPRQVPPLRHQRRRDEITGKQIGPAVEAVKGDFPQLR
jgi:hypothetical protein